MIPDPARILVIRRDNIGDLLLTTPLIHALREHYPHAELHVLVNSYNAPVLRANPDIDEVHAYVKAKHSEHSRLRAVMAELGLFLGLRRQRFDLIVQADPYPHPRSARLVNLLRPRHSLGVVADRNDRAYSIPLHEADLAGPHHVQRVFSLLRPLGIDTQPGPMRLHSDVPPTNVIGIHLSSRKPCNRWPLEHYIRVCRGLIESGYAVRAFWAPGAPNDPRHPGDDPSAQTLRGAVGDGLDLHPTHSLTALIDGIAGCRGMICCDGGALHISAALGIPVVALFGCTEPATWGPWATTHRVLEGHGEARAIHPDAALTAALDLFNL